jgi:DNA repair protein RecO (recombination protein O)
MTQDQLQPAYVLHSRGYGDTSLLLDVFAAAHGRLPLIAKGARRARRAGSSSQAALLQPFIPLLLAWSGRGEVKTLTRAEAAGRAALLVGDALYCGFYVNELLLRLLGRHDTDQVIFAAYQSVLAELAGSDLETPLRRFELMLLAQLGYRPPLDRDAESGAPVRADLRYVCDPERGPRCAAPTEASASIGGGTLLALAAGTALAPAQAREARDLMRRFLAPHLGERPLQSRLLFAARRRADDARGQAQAMMAPEQLAQEQMAPEQMAPEPMPQGE